MKSVLYYRIFTSLMILLLISCKTDHQKDYSNMLVYYPKLQKSVFRWDGLVLLNHSSAMKFWDKKNIKIINIISSDCPSCIIELKRWRNLLSDNALLNNIPFIVITIGEPSTYFIYQFNKIGFDFGVFYDPDSLLLQDEYYLGLVAEHSAILDQNDSIIYLGSPVLNPDLNEAFLKHIQKAITHE